MISHNLSKLPKTSYTGMSFNCGTDVWGNTYRLNREKANMDSRNNFGESNGPQSLPAFNTFHNKTYSSSFGPEVKKT